jgi:hypothetical protein
MERPLTRATLFIVAAVLMVREPARAQAIRASRSGVTSGSCASCALPLSRSWPVTLPQTADSGERHLVRVVGLTIAGAALGAATGVLLDRDRPSCSGDICGLRQSGQNQNALAGALIGTVVGFSVGMLIWGNVW